MQAVSLQFDMDYNLADSNTAWQGRLVYEPYATETVNTGAWQTCERFHRWVICATLLRVCPTDPLGFSPDSLPIPRPGCAQEAD